MNFVYVLGTGSRWQNNELRYSLRSLSNVAPESRSVIIVGHRPPWLKNVYHIAVKDIGKNPVENTSRKLEYALPELPDEFVLMNDDFFLMRPIAMIPILRGHSMAERVKRLNGRSGIYVDTFRRSYLELLSAGIYIPYAFDLHIPFPMEREKLRDLAFAWGAGRTRLKSLYGNVYYHESAVLGLDVKSNMWNGKTSFWSSTGNLLPAAKAILQRRFKGRSSYE